jgi:hypothetical protein
VLGEETKAGSHISFHVIYLLNCDIFSLLAWFLLNTYGAIIGIVFEY